jgi:hypothetical protein
MKISSLILALLVLMTNHGLADSPSSSAGNGKNQPNRLFVHGWEIQAISATRRASVAEILPQFDNGRPTGNERTTTQAKGEFLIVQFQYSWTSSGEPTDPLWAGKPNIKLVDSKGNEYPAIGMLTRQKGDYITVGMATLTSSKKHQVSSKKPQRALVYFDVPNGARDLSLVLAAGWAPISPPEVDDFSTGDIELPR